MTINELIDELCAIRDLAPGNGDMWVCTEQEVQLGELDTPMIDLAVDVAWFDGGTIRPSRSDCQKCYPPKVCYLHESENNEYSVCRPHDDIPKARPFTLTEFNERFKLGSPVHFIEKSGDHERRVIYTGYCIDNSDVWVSLGPNSYRLDVLFDHYKLAIAYVKKDDCEEPLWGVFGVDPGVYEYENSLQR